MPFVPHTPPEAARDHELLVAAFDAGDLDGTDEARAADLVRACDGCAELLADLAGLRAGARTLPRVPRTRDYRLTEADAERLRPTLGRRLLGWLAAPRSTVRPLAGGLAALGLAGLLLGTVPGMLGNKASTPTAAQEAQSGAFDRNAAGVPPAPGAASSAPAFSAGGSSAVPAASPAASAAVLGAITAPPPPTAAPSAAASAASSAGAAFSGSSPSPVPAVQEPTPPSPPVAAPSGGPAQATISPCPCGKTATGTPVPATSRPQPPSAAAATGGTGGGFPLTLVSAVLLGSGAALLFARLLARRLI